MIYKVFSIYDNKAEGYLRPFMFKTVGEAERSLSSVVAEDGHNFNLYSEDFDLYELGSWCEVTGLYNLHVSPLGLGKLTQYKKSVSKAKPVAGV